VQHYAFGQLWTGVPFGWDLTDNKTLLAALAWVSRSGGCARAAGTGRGGGRSGSNAGSLRHPSQRLGLADRLEHVPSRDIAGDGIIRRGEPR